MQYSTENIRYHSTLVCKLEKEKEKRICSNVQLAKKELNMYSLRHNQKDPTVLRSSKN